MQWIEKRFNVSSDYNKTDEIGVAAWLQELAKTHDITAVDSYYMPEHNQIYVLVQTKQLVVKKRVGDSDQSGA